MDIPTEFEDDDQQPISNTDNQAVFFEELITLMLNDQKKEAIRYLQSRPNYFPICLEALRGSIPGFEVTLNDEQINTQMWTPLLYAIELK